MSKQSLFQFFEKMAAAVAFAEADDRETAVRIAFPGHQQETKRVTREIREENRPVLHP